MWVQALTEVRVCGSVLSTYTNLGELERGNHNSKNVSVRLAYRGHFVD